MVKIFGVCLLPGGSRRDGVDSMVTLGGKGAMSMMPVSNKSRLIFHLALAAFSVMFYFASLFFWGSLALQEGKRLALTADRAHQLYTTSGRTLCRDQGNDWECRAAIIKGKEVFIRGKLVQP